MSRRKTISEDEKKDRLKKFFHESDVGVYSSKEVESAAAQATDMTMVQVKETLKLLIDDGTVLTEKLGNANFYWSFASYELNNKIVERDEHNAQIKHFKEKILAEKNKIEELQKGREENESRSKKLQQLEQLQKKNQTLKEELNGFADVEIIEILKKEIQIATEAANRYTDNIYCLQKYCDEKWSLTRQDFNNTFQVDPNMEHLE